MKLYPTINATLHIQSYGSNLLMVIKGDEQSIEAMFTGLYNLRATNDGTSLHPIKPDYTDESRTVATFWSNPEKMKRFFFNRYLFSNLEVRGTSLRRDRNGWKRQLGQLKHGLLVEATNYAKGQFELLKKESSVNFTPHQKPLYVPTYSQGTIKAERPDDDFKDAVLRNAFSDKNDKSPEEIVND